MNIVTGKAWIADNVGGPVYVSQIANRKARRKAVSQCNF